MSFEYSRLLSNMAANLKPNSNPGTSVQSVTGNLTDLKTGDNPGTVVFVLTDTQKNIYNVELPEGTASQFLVTNGFANPNNIASVISGAQPAQLLQIQQLKIGLDPNSPVRSSDGTYTGISITTVGKKKPTGMPSSMPSNAGAKKSSPAQIDDQLQPLPFTPVRVPFESSEGVRIGYAKFTNPIIHVGQTRSSYVDSQPVLRQTGSIKRGDGHSYQTYTLSWIATGPDEIRKSVQEVLEQIQLMPFTTVEGGPFANLDEIGEIPYHEIAIRNYSISTIDGMPNSLQCQLTFDPFNWEFYTPPLLPNPAIGYGGRFRLDDMYCWPLIKMYCKSRSKSQYTGLPFTGDIKLSFPDIGTSELLTSLLQSNQTYDPVVTDLSTLQALQQGAIAGDSSLLDQSNVKVLTAVSNRPYQADYYAVKLNSYSSWQQFVAEPPLNVQGPGVPEPSFAGLMDWNKISSSVQQPNYTSSNLQSAPGYLGANVADTSNYDGRTGTINQTGISLATQIQNYLLQSNYGSTNVPVSGDPNYPDYVNRVQPLITAQQTQPWLYYAVVLKTANPAAKSKLNSKLNQTISKLSMDPNASYKYTSINTQLKKQFIPDPQNTYSFGSSQDLSTSNILVERIAAQKSHNLSLTSTSHDPLPIHSYMGGYDGSFVVQGKAFGLEGKRVLEQLKATWETRSLWKRSRKFLSDLNDVAKVQEYAKSFLKVDNEIFQLMGVNFVMPISLDIESVDGQPGVWDWSFSFIEYDPIVLRSEEVKYIDTWLNNIGRIYEYTGFGGQQQTSNNSFSGGRTPITDRGMDWVDLQRKLQEEEIYPDMQLPDANELKIWIGALSKAAQSISKTKNASTSSLPEKGVNGVSPAEKGILAEAQVDEMLQYNYLAISQWPTSTSQMLLGVKSKYVDTDFYCYYDHTQSWEALFKQIGDDLHGSRSQTYLANGQLGLGLHAAGSTDPSQSGYRVTDPDNGGLTTVHPGTSWSVDDGTGSNSIAKLQADVLANTYPKDVLNQVSQVNNTVNAQFDSTPGAWWPNAAASLVSSIQNDTNTNTSTVVLTPQDQAAIYSSQIPPNTFNPVDMENLESQTSNTLQYFDLNWRQQQAKIAIAAGLNFNNKQSNLSNSSGNFLIQDAAKELSGRSVTMPQIEAFAKSAIQYQLSGQNGDPPINPVTLVSATFSSNNYLSLTAQANSNYAYYAGQSKATAITDTNFISSTLDQAIANMSPYIMWCSSHYAVDPNIVMSYFAQNNNIGATTSNGVFSLASTCIPATLQTGSPTLDAQAGILTFCQLYSNYKQYKYPSLILIAIEMTAKQDLRNKYFDTSSNTLSAATDARLLSSVAALDALGSNLFSQSGAAAVTQEVNKYTDCTQTLNLYQVAFYKISRCWGSFNLQGFQWDPYFNNLSSIVLMDNGNNGTTLPVTGPTGAVNSLNLDTNTATDSVVGAQPGMDARQKQKMLTKLRAALEPGSEAAIYGSLVDMQKHSVFGRLKGAFPSYQVLIINEGFYWQMGGRKLWDQYYTRTGVSDIEIFKSRFQPGSTCSITFSNAFYNLTAYAMQEAKAQQMAVQNQSRMEQALEGGLLPALPLLFDDWITKKIPEDLIRLAKNNHIKALALQVGARLQVRMGYGSDASQLPVVFNGSVIEVPVQDGFVTVYAVGDGCELEKPCTKKLTEGSNANRFTDGGFLGIGKDPSSIVTEAIVGASLWDNLTGGNFRDMSNGVAHFGEVYWEGVIHRPAEIQINIYGSSETQLEQGIPAIKNYFNTAALYNWSSSNLISVDVDEPTPWKVIEVCRHACLDFVASAEPFGMRTSLFFGKWWWPFNYQYSDTILGALDAVKGPAQSQPPTTPNNLTIDGTKRQVQVANNRNDPKNPSQLNGLPVSFYNHATNYYSGAPVAIAKKRSNGDWRIQYDDGASVMLDGNLGYALSNSLLMPSPNDLAAYRKKQIQTGDIKGQTYKQYLNEQYPTVQPGTALDRSTSTDDFDPLTDVNKLVQYLDWKNYMQCYIAHSGLNLLQNNIRADGEKVFTDAYGTRKETNALNQETLLKTIQFSIDSNIEPGDRKTIEVNTQLQVTAVQNLGEAVVNHLVPWVPGADFIQETPSTAGVENGVVSVLIDTVKEMYQGEFVMMGMATIKPHDLILVTDHRNNMKGPVFVKEVVHKMNCQEGFLTIVTPDAVVLPHSSQMGSHMIESLCSGFLHRMGAFMVYRIILASTWGFLKNKVKYSGDLSTSQGAQSFDRIASKTDIAQVELNAKNLAAKEALNKKADADIKALDRQSKSYAEDVEAIEAKRKSDLASLASKPDYGALGLDADAINKSGSDFILKVQKKAKELAASEAEDIAKIKDGKLPVFGSDIKEAIRARKHLTQTQKASFLDQYPKEVAGLLGVNNRKEAQKLARSLQTLQTTRQATTNTAHLAELDEEIQALNEQIRLLVSDIPVDIKDTDELIRFVSNTEFLKFTGYGITKPSVVGTTISDTVGPYLEFFSKMPTGRMNSVLKAQNIKTKVDVFVSGAKRAAAKTKSTVQELRAGGDAAKEAADVARLLAKEKFLKSYEILKDVYTGFRLAKYAGGPFISLACDTIQYIIAGAVINGVNARLRARNVAKIYPLFVGNVPYVAGVRGHQGLVVGDDPSWADKLLTGYLTPGDGQWHGASTITGLLASGVGIEVPDHAVTDADARFVTMMQNQNN